MIREHVGYQGAVVVTVSVAVVPGVVDMGETEQ
jgi:hypothetical protein